MKKLMAIMAAVCVCTWAYAAPPAEFKDTIVEALKAGGVDVRTDEGGSIYFPFAGLAFNVSVRDSGMDSVYVFTVSHALVMDDVPLADVVGTCNFANNSNPMVKCYCFLLPTEEEGQTKTGVSLEVSCLGTDPVIFLNSFPAMLNLLGGALGDFYEVDGEQPPAGDAAKPQ
jgi:hypothetical protein